MIIFLDSTFDSTLSQPTPTCSRTTKWSKPERKCCIAAESMNSPHECECDLSMSSSRNVILQGWASSSIPPSSKQTKPTKVLESEACGARALPQELATGPAAAGRGHGDWMRGAGWLGGWAAGPVFPSAPLCGTFWLVDAFPRKKRKRTRNTTATAFPPDPQIEF